ncbi:MAG: YdcF family protein [Clostridia bacterium]|nr:YdcF family protein [Clostridia bacterium]
MKKFDRALTAVYAVFGSFSFLTFLIYLVKLIFFPEDAQAVFAASFVCLAVALPAIFRKPLKKLLKRAYPVLKCAMCACLVFFAVSFGVLSVSFFTATETAAPDSFSDDTVFLVFGAYVEKTGLPSDILADRLDKAAEAMTSAPGSVCIVSGGKGDNEPVAEADAMRAYLTAKGIGEDRIITEDRARNTVENIAFSKPLIDGTGKGDLVCVSTFTHTPRIKRLCSRAGLSPRFINSGFPRAEFAYPAFVREYLSVVKMILSGN